MPFPYIMYAGNQGAAHEASDGGAVGGAVYRGGAIYRGGIIDAGPGGYAGGFEH